MMRAEETDGRVFKTLFLLCTALLINYWILVRSKMMQAEETDRRVFKTVFLPCTDFLINYWIPCQVQDDACGGDGRTSLQDGISPLYCFLVIEYVSGPRWCELRRWMDESSRRYFSFVLLSLIIEYLSGPRWCELRRRTDESSRQYFFSVLLSLIIEYLSGPRWC